MLDTGLVFSKGILVN